MICWNIPITYILHSDVGDMVTFCEPFQKKKKKNHRGWSLNWRSRTWVVDYPSIVYWWCRNLDIFFFQPNNDTMSDCSSYPTWKDLHWEHVESYKELLIHLSAYISFKPIPISSSQTTSLHVWGCTRALEYSCTHWNDYFIQTRSIKHKQSTSNSHVRPLVRYLQSFRSIYGWK